MHCRKVEFSRNFSRVDWWMYSRSVTNLRKQNTYIIRWCSQISAGNSGIVTVNPGFLLVSGYELDHRLCTLTNHVLVHAICHWCWYLRFCTLSYMRIFFFLSPLGGSNEKHSEMNKQSSMLRFLLHIRITI